MTTQQKIIRNKLGLINLAQELGNVAKACPLLRVLTDRGTEYCGRADGHGYQLYLAVNDIEHTRTKARHPQTNGICERFHKTVLHEFYNIAFRKRIYSDLEQLQEDLDQWVYQYNNDRTHLGKMCCGRTPMQTFLDAKPIIKQKTNDLNEREATLAAL